MAIYQFDQKERDNLEQVLASGSLAARDDGFVGRFERAVAERMGARHGVAGSSAMALLHAAVNAAGAGAGDEVICDPIVQFHAVASMYNNAHPVFADVLPETWLIDPGSVKKLITKHTKAIVATNLWGYPCALDELRQIADDHGVKLIEDCAHAWFTPYRGKYCGTWGHIGVYSCNHGKHLTTGDGGVAVTDDPQLDRRLRGMLIFGESPPELAWNYRMTELEAAIGLAQLDKVPGYIEVFNKNAEMLDAVVDGCKWLDKRALPSQAGRSSYHWSCAFQGKRAGVSYDAFKAACKEVGAPISFGFTQVPAYQYKVFSEPLAYGNKGCPIKCAYYQGEYWYKPGLCPVAEDLIPRLCCTGVMSQPEPVARAADLLGKAIAMAEKG